MADNIPWVRDQLGNAWYVAEGEREWIAKQMEQATVDADGNMVLTVSRDEIERHCVNLAKMRDLAELLFETLGGDQLPEGRPS